MKTFAAENRKENHHHYYHHYHYVEANRVRKTFLVIKIEMKSLNEIHFKCFTGMAFYLARLADVWGMAT